MDVTSLTCRSRNRACWDEVTMTWEKFRPTISDRLGDGWNVQMCDQNVIEWLTLNIFKPINKNPTNTQQSRALFLTCCTCSQPLKTCFVRTSFQISCCRSTMEYLYIITCKDSEARHLLSWTPEPKIPSWASLSRSHIFKMPYFIRKTIDWISNLAHKCRPQVSLDGTLKSSPWHWWHWP